MGIKFHNIIGLVLILLWAIYPRADKSIPTSTNKLSMVDLPTEVLDSIIQLDIRTAAMEDSILAGIPTTKRQSWIYRRNPKDLTEDDLSIMRDHITKLNDRELKKLMIEMGFNLPDKISRSDLERCYIAFHYEGLYFEMNERTGLPQSVMFSYHIHESIGRDGETRKFSEDFNFGGIKYRQGTRKTRYKDDCYDAEGRSIPCEFSAVSSYREGVELWVAVFNQKRYESCKTYTDPMLICECLYKGKYHTSKRWRDRGALARKYWWYRQMLPQ